MNGPHVLGLDLSLTGTGIAHVDGTTEKVDTDPLRGTDRLGVIRAAVEDAVCAGPPDLVVIEGYSYASKGRALFQLGELGGVVHMLLADLSVTCCPGMGWCEAPPQTLKKFATGSTSADKTKMVCAARERLAWDGYGHDEADALWLRALGYELLGSPLIKLPLVNLTALEGVQMLRKPALLRQTVEP